MYDKVQILYGIDCERCHGAASEHVAFQQAHTEEKTAKYIIRHEATKQAAKAGWLRTLSFRVQEFYF